jgi:tryptophan synthase alpha chain
LSDGPIAEQWRRVRDQRRAALIPYLTAGFPSLGACRDALRMLADTGADFVEVGVPFSDPLADGPVIQRSSQTALDQGMTLARVLELIRTVRLTVPVIVFSYLNPILAYGMDRFVRDARDAGVAGLLLTDLPAGEDPALEGTVRAGGLDLIRLIAPTTEGSRLADAVRGASGFLYLISRLGVTGARTTLDEHSAQVVARVRAASDLPVAVGFGLATGEQARAVGQIADGVVVGTALVERLARGLEPARALMTELSAAVQGPFDRRKP